ncbi:MAG: hypothetical protein M1819_003268 [Sarea resinae]|nr:MAG: hypothetical protein M1819_003268 [Sarea resinae]
MPAQLSPEFEQACEDSRKLTEKPSSDELLQLYALFRQGRQDPPWDPSKSRPGVFSLQERYKYDAWKELVDEDVSAEEAQRRYVKLVEELKVKYKFDPSKQPEHVKK